MVRLLSFLDVIVFIVHSGTGANLSDTSLPFALPGSPSMPIVDYPEG